jgi:DNA-binding NtrC family response regulator
MLKDKRILFVEDEPIVALDLEVCILDRGGVIAGRTGSFAEAERLAELDGLDGAILDLSLQGQPARAILERLIARGIRCVLHSAHSNVSLAKAWPSVPIIGKPARTEAVVDMLDALIQAQPQTP